MTPAHPRGARARRLGRQPGDPSPRTRLERILRVDHAGEYGAVQIYEGQLAVLGGGRRAARVISDMAEAERRHLDEFDALLLRHRVRPTLLSPLWRLAGRGLGAATALMGERAAMACTAAVEEVIDGHYARQAEALGENEPALRATIERFRADEIEHRETARRHGAEAAPGYPLLARAIKGGVRLAIRLSERV